MSGSGSVSSNCSVLSEYDSQPYYWVAEIRIVTGFFSLLCSFFLIAFFVYTKKQRRVTNEILVFCLAISTLLNSWGYLLGRVNFYTDRPLLDEYCLFAGLLELYTGWTGYMCILCISSNLLAQVTCQPPTGKKLKWVYCSLIFALPLLWCWLPYVDQAYGSAGPWCGIRTLTNRCDPFLYGVLLRVFLEGLPILFLLLITSIFSLATWICLKHRLQSLEANSLSRQTTVDKTEVQAELRTLLWFPPLYPLLQLSLLVNIVYSTAQPSSPQLALWLLQALLSPLAGAVTAVLIGVHTETNARTRLRTWLTRHLCRRGKEAEREGSRKRSVSEYQCDVNVSYGDSISGVMDRNRRERIRNNSSNPSQPPSLSESQQQT